MSRQFFQSYDQRVVETATGASIFTLTSPDTSKPPLLLIHGYPQTHVEYHKIAPLLEPHFSLVLVDLRGYGNSGIVASKDGSGMSKQLMAADLVAVMQSLGYQKFSVLGHDRGARVAYRMAFDSPQHVDRLIVVDVVPTAANFAALGAIEKGIRTYHWLFLAQPEPFPEIMIAGKDGGKYFLHHTLASWTGKKNLKCFDPEALKEYERAYCKEERIRSTCEDYRAGALIDAVHDQEDFDARRKIGVKMLVVWGGKGSVRESPLDVWRKWADDVVGVGIECGHFVPEERPEELVREVLKFMGV